MKEVWFFPNGNTAVTEDGEQVAELQIPWINIFARFLASKEVDPTKCVFHLQIGDAKMFKTEDGYSWEVTR